MLTGGLTYGKQFQLTKRRNNMILNGAVKQKLRRTKFPIKRSPTPDHFEKEMEGLGIELGKSIYEEANQHEDIELFEIDGFNTEDQLQSIAEQIRVRTKISQREIFKIGGLLCRAKQICIKDQIGFKDWIDKTFDFCYKMANNFMNVHKYCLIYQNAAVQIPRSILYKISAPNFPEELRQYVFETADFDELTNKKFAKLKKKYDEDGLEALDGHIKEMSRAELVKRQIASRLDLTENILRKMKQLNDKFRAGIYGQELVAFEVQMDSLEPEASEISKSLYRVIEQSYNAIKKALKEAEQERNKFADEVLDKV